MFTLFRRTGPGRRTASLCYMVVCSKALLAFMIKAVRGARRGGIVPPKGAITSP